MNPWIAVVLAASSWGCQGEPAAPHAGSAAAAAAAPPPPVPRIVDAKVPDAPAGPVDGEVTLDGASHPLRYGYADAGIEGAYIHLSSSPASCASKPTTGFAISFQVPPGPGAAYFAGHAVSTAMTVQAFAEHDANLPGLPGPRLVPIDASLVTLEPMTPKSHAHIRGVIDGAEGTLLGTAEAHAHFEVELCLDLEAKPLRSEAPARAVSGRLGGATLVPRTVHAIVYRRTATHDEAIDKTIQRTTGSIPEISLLVFYAKANVPCPQGGDGFMPNGALIAAAQGIGGTSQAHPALGGQQPTTLIWYGPEGAPLDIADVWPGWVRVDAPLDYTAGTTLHATLWSEPGPNSRGTGSFGGRVTAVVCTP